VDVASSYGSKLDLKLIDETYGNNADLYEDVLRVSTTATQDEIQLAYFDRRSELFTMLAKIDAAARGPRSELSLASVDQRRYLAERKMDSVVFAVRILADPALRKAYNRIRPERTSIESSSLNHTSVGYTLQQSPSAVIGSSAAASISRSSSATSESSTKSSNRAEKHSIDNDNLYQQPPQMPRVVTPTELPPVARSSSSASESKNWIQSTFSSSLFSSIGGHPSKTEDDLEEYDRDEERNSRKSKRKHKQQQSSSTHNRDRDAEPIQKSNPESSGEKEKKSIWGRKKRKKKKQNKDELGGMFLNNSIDVNATDTSMTDYEDVNYRNKEKAKDIDSSSRPKLSNKSSTSNTDYEVSPHEAVRREGELRRYDGREIVDDETLDETLDDDDTRTFHGDDGETFATGSVFSNPGDEEPASCGGDGMFGCLSGSKAFKRIATEVSGACEDTLVSVDQVFHAFTLTDKDIKAVRKKIHKAKRQLES